MAKDLMRRNDELMYPFGDLLNDFFEPRKDGWFNTRAIAPSMRTDVTEDDSGYSLKIELPGLNKKDIDIRYDNGVLTVKGTLKSSVNEKNTEHNWVRSERHYGEYSRSYSLPHVDQTKIMAKYDNGVLALTLPKTKEASASHIEIED